MPSDFTWGDIPNDPSHPLPQGPLEPLQFQAATDVDRIIVDLGDGDELCAWRDGAFRGSFAARSSMDVSRNVVLFREGGWPRPPKVIPKVKESSSGPLPALLPVGWRGATSQYACRVVGGVQSGADRSGNGNELGSGNRTSGPDLIRGETCFCPGVYPGNVLAGPIPASRTWTGAMSVIARFAATGFDYVSNYHHVINCRLNGNANGLCPWGLGVNPDGKLVCYWQNAAGVYQIGVAAGGDLRDGIWHHVGFSRPAAGTSCKLYVDGVATAVTGLDPPTTTANTGAATTWIGAATGGGWPNNEFFNGSLGDINTFGNIELVAADFTDARKIMMGLP